MANDLFDLSGRVALITGGSRGLGKAMAQALAAAGARVAISARTEAELRATADELAAGSGREVAWFKADMSNRADVQRLADDVLARMGQVDVLINNAGSNRPQVIDEISDADWDGIVQLNLSSCMALTRALAPQMKQRRWGRVIFISSIMALVSKQGRGAYSATKNALIGLAKAAALDLAEFGITVNCIAPGPFLTDLPASVLSADEQRVFASRTALGRWGDPREIAGPALLLASDAGSYITGTVLVVDGGALAKGF